MSWSHFAVLLFNYLHYHRHHYVHDMTLVVSKIHVFFGISLQTVWQYIPMEGHHGLPIRECKINTTPHSILTAEYSARRKKLGSLFSQKTNVKINTITLSCVYYSIYLCMYIHTHVYVEVWK